MSRHRSSSRCCCCCNSGSGFGNIFGCGFGGSWIIILIFLAIVFCGNNRRSSC